MQESKNKQKAANSVPFIHTHSKSSPILVKKGDKEGAEEASAKARVLGWKEELAQENEEG